MNKSIVLVLAVMTSIGASAQQKWSLAQCIDYAIKNNITIKQYETNERLQEVQLSTSRNSRLPSLDANIGQNFSFGRGLTADNTYTNTNTSSSSFSLGTSMPLFTGFQIPNQIKLNQLNLKAATADLEKARNDVSMRVAQSYVEILYNMEVCDVAKRQITIDSLQMVRLQAMVDNGKASEVQLSQQRSAMAQSKLALTQADNNYRLSVLALTQLLEMPSPDGFSIVRPSANLMQKVLPAPDVIYEEALGIKPEIQSEQLRVQGAKTSVKLAQSGLYPQLSLSAGLGTNYYKTSGYKASSFGEQIKNNFSQYIGFNLSIPIFNRFATRNNIRSARLQLANQELQLDNAKKSLYKEIQQVYYNAVAAHSKYESSNQACVSTTDAFNLVRAKYENGKANITEFNESRNNLLKAESDLVQAKYEYLYQTSLLDFYRGKPLDF